MGEVVGLDWEPIMMVENKCSFFVQLQLPSLGCPVLRRESLNSAPSLSPEKLPKNGGYPSCGPEQIYHQVREEKRKPFNNLLVYVRCCCSFWSLTTPSEKGPQKNSICQDKNQSFLNIPLAFAFVQSIKE